jgi:hypothetical protein
MSKKVNEKGLASGKGCWAFFLGEGFEASVYQIPRLVIKQLVEFIETCRDTETCLPTPVLFSSHRYMQW